jgi:hypothetical protein
MKRVRKPSTAAAVVVVDVTAADEVAIAAETAVAAAVVAAVDEAVTKRFQLRRNREAIFATASGDLPPSRWYGCQHQPAQACGLVLSNAPV